ncbi:UNVERIFIED_CONTAM: hypothetical protein H355_007044 [Colinus virginianus]|nr:hypothetical protein H355_007044 [Colinus virginianus]
MRGSGRASPLLVALLLHGLRAVLSANTGFSVSVYDVTSSSIYLRWSKFSGASSYRVTATAENTVGHSLLARFGDVTLKSTLTSLIPNTVYAIQAEAIDKNGNILAEAQTMQSTAPDIPVIDQAYSKLSSSITVEWRAVPGATSYLLAAQDGDSCIETLVTKSPGTVMGLKPATWYRITIRSVNAGGRSRPSASRKATTVLSAPVLSASSPRYDSIAVSWKAVYMAAGFCVSLMRSDGLGRMLKQNTTNTSFVFSHLDPGTLYTIKAYAWSANGLPGDDFTYNQRTIPCAPGNISIEEDERGNLLVSWSRVNFGHYYVVFVKSDDGLEVYCNTSRAQCYFQSDCGFTYFISVFAYNKAGQSPLGDVFNYTTGSKSGINGIEIEQDTFGSLSYEAQRQTVRFSAQAERSMRALPVPAPCCPSDFRAVLVSSDTVEVSWAPVRGAEMYETKAASWRDTVLCNDTATACTLSALRCDTRYNVTVHSFSEARGSNTSCASKDVATGACCPSGVKLYRLGSNGIRVYWRASEETVSYTTHLHGSKGTFTCTPSPGLSYCDITEIPCGDVYTVVVSPATDRRMKLTFCPKKIYSAILDVIDINIILPKCSLSEAGKMICT